MGTRKLNWQKFEMHIGKLPEFYQYKMKSQHVFSDGTRADWVGTSKTNSHVHIVVEAKYTKAVTSRFVQQTLDYSKKLKAKNAYLYTRKSATIAQKAQKLADINGIKIRRSDIIDEVGASFEKMLDIDNWWKKDGTVGGKGSFAGLKI